MVEIKNIVRNTVALSKNVNILLYLFYLYLWQPTTDATTAAGVFWRQRINKVTFPV